MTLVRIERARRSVGRHRLLSTVSAFAVVGLGTVGVVRHANLTVSYLVVVLSLAVVVALGDDRVRFTRPALCGLALWGVLHLAGGLIELDDGRILYNTTITRWIHFDNVVHVIGFGSAGLACVEALQVVLGMRISGRTAWVVTAVAAMGAGAFNEVVEFFAGHWLGAANVGGYENTGRDLVANLLGGSIAGWWASRTPWGGLATMARRRRASLGSTTTPLPGGLRR